MKRTNTNSFAKQKPSTHHAVMGAVTVLLSTFSSIVLAQSAADVQTVEITGSLIRGALPAGTPIIGITRADIEKSGASNAVDLLRQLPQISNLGADEGHLNTAQNANQNVTVGSGINLRGLGPESTLLLLNGRRLAPGGVAGQYSDPSWVPAIAIQKMEVLTDGASSTYGSDAVGGVVNMKLRSLFDGSEVQVRRGGAQGMSNQQASGIFGRQWDNGGVMFAIDRSERGALSADNRRFYTDDMRPWGGPDLRVFNANPGNIQVGSVRYAIPAGQNGVGLSPANVIAGTANLQSATKGISALPEQNKTSAVFSYNQDLTDKVQFALEGYWSEREFSRELIAYNGNYTVRKGNPFFYSPTGATSSVVNYSFFNDLGTARSTGFERSQQLAAILSYDLPSKWKGTTYVTHSVTQERNLSPTINANAVNAALADTNPLTALNLFCDGSKFTCNNPATLAKLPAFSDRNSKFTMVDLASKVDGPLFEVAAGTVSMALGAEYRSDKLPYYLLSNNTTPSTATTNYVDNHAFNPERTVKSVFVEAAVPLISEKQGISGIKRMDMSLSTRNEQYSDFGSTSNPKIGLSLVPVEGTEFRGSYSTAFRAPTLGDTDPVNGSAVNYTTRVAADGKIVLSGILYLGGNPEGLKPETAKITTFGMAFKPAAIKGLMTSVDWFNIDYTNRILTPGNDNAVLQRADLAPYANMAPTAAQIQAALANPVYSGSQTPGPVQFIVDGRRKNAGAVQTSGFDLNARYAFETSAGVVTTGLYGSYLTKYAQQLVPGTPMVDLLNKLNNPMRFRARAELGLARQGEFAITSFFNYTNSYTNNSLATNPKVESSTTVDLNARWDFGKHLTSKLGREMYMTVSVQNLFDRQPPYVQNGTLAFDPQNVSAIGRSGTVMVGTRW